jgi:sec-independent protein translocase protein TatA
MLGIFQNIGAPELIIILVIVLLIFGASRLPEIARSLGRSSREFKQGMKEGATDEPDADGSAAGSSSGPPIANQVGVTPATSYTWTNGGVIPVPSEGGGEEPPAEEPPVLDPPPPPPPPGPPSPPPLP